VRKKTAKQIQFVTSAAKAEKATGISRNTIYGYIQTGQVTKGPKGYAIADIIKVNESPSRKPRRRSPAPADVTTSRARRELAEAIIKELKAKQLASQLVSLDSVIRCWQKYILNARRIIETLPHAISMLEPDIEHRALQFQEVTRIANDALRELEEGGKLDGMVAEAEAKKQQEQSIGGAA
jgi:hypothetical protein